MLATFKCSDSQAGFSLGEVAVATGILAAALVALAQLFAIATASNKTARNSTFATVLAYQKMEQLRGLTYGFDTLGLPITDTQSDTAKVPAAAAGGTGLTPAPKDALIANKSGFVDYLDAYGNSLGGGTALPQGTAYIRRWAIEPLPINPNNTLILQVLVTRRSDRGAAANAGDIKRMPDEARLISVKTRKAS